MEFTFALSGSEGFMCMKQTELNANASACRKSDYHSHIYRYFEFISLSSLKPVSNKMFWAPLPTVLFIKMSTIRVHGEGFKKNFKDSREFFSV